MRTPRADGARASARRSPALPAAAPRRRRAPRAPMQTARTRNCRTPSCARAAMRGEFRERSGNVRKTRDARRAAGHCGHNPRKRHLFSPTACRVSIPAPRKSPRSTPIGGTMTRPSSGGSETGVEPLADAARERGLADDEERHVGAERQRRSRARSARATAERPRAVERQQHRGRVRAAAAQPAAQRNALVDRDVDAERAARRACSARAARTARSSRRRDAGHSRVRRIAPSARTVSVIVSPRSSATNSVSSSGSRRRAAR